MNHVEDLHYIIESPLLYFPFLAHLSLLFLELLIDPVHFWLSLCQMCLGLLAPIAYPLVLSYLSLHVDLGDLLCRLLLLGYHLLV